MFYDQGKAKYVSNSLAANILHRLLFLFFLVALTACGTNSSSGGGDAVVPTIPGNVVATTGDQRVTVSWSGVPGADSYNVYASTTSGTGTSGTFENVANAPYYHDGVTNGTDYYYVVTAVTAGVESDASSEATTVPADILITSLTFTDPNLEMCVINTGATFVHDLTSLTCGASNVADLTGIEALTSMTNLDLFINNIDDISALASLTRLTSLVLAYNDFTDISVLNNLTNLTYLSLSNNTIAVADINALLSNLNSLTGLSLSGLSLGDAGLSTLAPNLDGLLFLIITNNSFVDVSPIASVTSLEVLNISNNSIVDVDPLANLTSLTDLYLYNNNISSIAPLVTLTGLTSLTLAYNNIVDVSPLATLTALNYLYLDNNSIGGQGVGNVDALTALTGAINIGLVNNLGMSCAELGTLISTLGSLPVDVDNNYSNSDTATNGVNCTNP